MSFVLQISKDDGLPSHICKKCSEETKRIHDFIELCKKSEQTLNQYHQYLQSTQEPETKTETAIKSETIDEDINKEVLNNISSDDEYYDDTENHSLETNLKKEQEECTISEKASIINENLTGSTRNLGKKLLKTRSKTNFIKKGLKRKKKYKKQLDECSVEPDVVLIKTETEEKYENDSDRSTDRKIACKNCDQVFEDIVSYKEHSKTHSKKCKSNGPFGCKECGKEFKFRKNLWQHERSHGEKKFLCTYCGRAFLVMATLNEHVRMHTGMFNYYFFSFFYCLVFVTIGKINISYCFPN